MGKVRSRKELLREQAEKRAVFVGWLQERIENRKKAKLLAGQPEVEPAGHGVTRQMRNIRNSVPQVRFDEAKGPNREARRHDAHHGRPVRPSLNQPYVNPARDLRKGRRLRS